MNIRVLAVAAGLLIAVPMTAFAAEPTTATPAPVAAPAPAATLELRYAQLVEGKQFSKEELAEFSAQLDAAKAETPGDFRWKLASAILLRSSGDAKGSVDSLTALAKSNPKSAEVQNQLGMSLMATMKSDMGFMKMAGVAGEAKDAWQSAIEIDPNHVMARYALAQYEIGARKQGGFLFGSYSKARAHGEALLKVPGEKGRFWGLMALGAVDAAQEEWGDMTKHYDAAEAAAPSSPLRSMAQAFHATALINEKKDAKAALPLVERAIASAEPNNYNVYFLRGSVRKELGDCPGAIKDFNLVLERNPDAQNTRILLAQCCETSGDKAAALAHYEEYVKRFPKGQRLSEANAGIKRLKRA